MEVNKQSKLNIRILVLFILISIILIAILVMAGDAPNVTVTNNIPLNNTNSNNATYQNFTCTMVTENTINQTIINMSLYFNGVLNTTNKTAVLNNTAYNFTLQSTLANRNYQWNCEVCVNDTINPCKFSSNFTFTLDSTAPTVSIIYPADGASISNNSIDLNATATDNINSSSMTYYWVINGTTNSTTIDSNSTFNASDGYYNLTLFVSDNLQNGSSSSYFTLDTIMPKINITSTVVSGNNMTLNNWDFINVTSSDDNGEHMVVLDWNKTLKGWWKFEPENGSMLDNSSYNNHGNETSAEYTSAGKYGAGRLFDGLDDCVNINGLVDDVTSDTTGTIIAWVKYRASTGNPNPTILSIGDIDDSKALIVGLGAGVSPADEFRVALYTGTGTYDWDLDTDTSVNPHEWIHLAIVQNGTEPVLYVNGDKPDQAFRVNTDITTWISDISSVDNARIGSRNVESSGDDSFFNGTIDDLKIYSRVLSMEEINATYNANLHQYNHNFTGLTNGNYTFTAYAQDLAGNMNNTGTYTITVDISAPTITNLINRTTDDGSDTFYTNDNIYCNATITDNLALDTVIFSFSLSDGTWHNNTVTSPTSTYSFNITSTNISDAGGEWLVWRYYANDTVGNLQEGALVNYFVNALAEEDGVTGGHTGGSGVGTTESAAQKKSAEQNLTVEIPFIKRLISTYTEKDNGICDYGEWLLLHGDCALDKDLFYQMWFLRIILFFSICLLIRKNKYFPLSVMFLIVLFYVNGALV